MKKYLFSLFFLALAAAALAQKPNILFIAIDDLKPELGCYGNKLIKTPNIDRLAAKGVVFMRNYCQQAVCGPTRASLMTGKRPDHTQVWDLKTKMRDKVPDILSLPQYLVSQGYVTAGIGKIYDRRCVDADLDKPSWSVPFYDETEGKYYPKGIGKPVLGQYQSDDTKLKAGLLMKEALDKGMTQAKAKQYANEGVRPSTECMALPDNAYEDGANALMAKDLLAGFAASGKPFFFGVGFHKPHLPFVAPKKYWDLYKESEMPVAPFQEKSKNGVDIAYHNAAELRLYTDIPPLLSFTDQKSFGITLSKQQQQHLIHGYYAAVSYTDAQVGLLMKALDSLGLAKNTIVVLWGDHGWHLGDHNLWCKHTNFEQATRTPMIIAAPGLARAETNGPSEFVDIFPTLCDLSGLAVPNGLDGNSLVPQMKKPSLSVKNYAVSQYPRTLEKAEAEKLGLANNKCMGYSIRDKRYRFTIWMANDFRTTQAFDAKLVIGKELYDYEKDPNETVNQVSEKAYSKVAQEMEGKMIAYFATQNGISK